MNVIDDRIFVSPYCERNGVLRFRHLLERKYGTAETVNRLFMTETGEDVIGTESAYLMWYAPGKPSHSSTAS